MIKNIIIIALVASLAWFGTTIIRLQNYIYASQMGFCQQYELPSQSQAKHECLLNKQTRTSPIWHLLHGLRIV